MFDCCWVIGIIHDRTWKPISSLWWLWMGPIKVLLVLTDDILKCPNSHPHKPRSLLPVWTTTNTWSRIRAGILGLPIGRQTTFSTRGELDSFSNLPTQRPMILEPNWKEFFRETGIRHTLIMFDLMNKSFLNITQNAVKIDNGKKVCQNLSNGTWSEVAQVKWVKI